MRTNKAMRIIGWIVGVLPCVLMLFRGYLKLARVPMAAEGFARAGFKPGHLLPIGIVEVACVAIYLFPRTAVLGAILITGYMGGATVTHVRAGEAFIMPILVGVLVWLGIFLRDARVRELLPLRSTRSA